MAGDYLFYKRQYSDKTIDRTVVAADTSAEHADVITPKSANHRIYIQKITVAFHTHADQTITFQDGAGTPVKVAVITDEATVVPTVPSTVQYDFGPKGFPLTLGEELDIVFSAAGIAAAIHIEAYEKLDAVISYLAGASLQ